MNKRFRSLKWLAATVIVVALVVVGAVLAADVVIDDFATTSTSADVTILSNPTFPLTAM